MLLYAFASSDSDCFCFDFDGSEISFLLLLPLLIKELATGDSDCFFFDFDKRESSFGLLLLLPLLNKCDPDFDEVFCCVVFVDLESAGIYASPSCLITFAIGSALLLFVPLPALLFVALPNVEGDVVGAVGVGATGQNA